jgi:hypothetical protein
MDNWQSRKEKASEEFVRKYPKGFSSLFSKGSTELSLTSGFLYGADWGRESIWVSTNERLPKLGEYALFIHQFGRVTNAVIAKTFVSDDDNKLWLRTTFGDDYELNYKSYPYWMEVPLPVKVEFNDK